MGAIVSPILLFLAVSLACSPKYARAQEDFQELDAVKAAIVTGNAAKLMSLTSGRLELALLGASRQYSRSQAILVLRKFFVDNPPQSFMLVDSTQSSKGLFLEGRMRTRNSDQVLRVYLRMNRIDGTWTLREMLVERADR